MNVRLRVLRRPTCQRVVAVAVQVDARVADGSSDLAVCWEPDSDLERLGLVGRRIGADR
ncbi:hypothetical protein ACI1MP_06405 [Kitasatospora griseola]|uniref:hypothetical protein n=1 Tax=Kitasatospora griseola TaxID=2064 RepID=UPI0038556CB3